MTNIVTPQSVKTAQARCTAAKTTLTDGTNAVQLLVAGASGAVLYGLTALTEVTVTATKCQLYRKNGATWTLIRTALMGAYTMAQNTLQTPTDFGFTETAPRRLAANEELWVGVGVTPTGGGIVFDAQYEDL
jgi:hypothetical protein